MSDALSIYEIISKANSIALLADENSQENELLAREALSAALRQRGASVFLLPETTVAFKEKWGALAPAYKNPEITYQTSIHIPKDRIKITEINYEEKDNDVILRVDSLNSPLKENDFSIKPSVANIDAALCFGGNGDSESLKTKFPFIAKEKIFSLTNSEKFLAKTVFGLIDNLGEKYLSQSPIPTLLLASLVFEIEKDKSKNNNDALMLAGSLVKYGADKGAIKNISDKSNPPDFSQLLGRALARTRVINFPKSAWTFMPFQDFAKTNISENDINENLISKLIFALQPLVPHMPTHVFLWNQNNEISGLIMTDNNSDQAKKTIAEELGGVIKNGLISAGSYKNFSEAELKIKNALKLL